MKITTVPAVKNTHQFKALPDGSVFRTYSGGALCMKCIYDSGFNAVLLNSGALKKFPEDMQVEIVTGSFVEEV